MTATLAVRRLQRIALALRAGDVLDADDARQVAAGIETWLTGHADTLDEALGVRQASGPSARFAVMRCERDELLRAAAERFFAGESLSGAAEHLARELARYRAAGWRHDRVRTECPDRLIGKLGEFLWAILRARDADMSARSIRRALGQLGGSTWPTEVGRIEHDPEPERTRSPEECL